MLLKLAWRNIWRNRRRSIIVLASITVGIIATVITDALSRGMVFQMLENQIGSHVSHIQIHRKGFKDNPVIQNTIPDARFVDSLLSNAPGVRHYSRRTLNFGILSSATSSSGVSIVGIEPDREGSVTRIRESVVKGTYLSGRNNEIVIGTKLAEKLGVDVGSKVVGMASALDGHVGSDVFRITGLYESFSSEFDRTFVYIPLPNAQEMLTLNGKVSEFAVLVNDVRALDSVRDYLQHSLTPDYEILSYPEILPLLIMQIDLYAESMIIFYAIIAIAVIFGIVNSMLMSVFERIREFGVLKAIGMKNGRLFLMVVVEAFYLGAIGSAAGFAISYALYVPLSHSGIDLSLFSEGLRSFGSGTVIYPVLTWDIVANALLVVPLVAVLGSLYPAFRATRLEPISALRYV
jgi:ABC-type lipoprotein release transport system permease subunit